MDQCVHCTNGFCGVAVEDRTCSSAAHCTDRKGMDEIATIAADIQLNSQRATHLIDAIFHAAEMIMASADKDWDGKCNAIDRALTFATMALEETQENLALAEAIEIWASPPSAPPEHSAKVILLRNQLPKLGKN